MSMCNAKAGRKRSRRTMQPRDAKELEVDVTDAMYSSSQQINGQHKPGMLCDHLLGANDCFTK